MEARHLIKCKALLRGISPDFLPSRDRRIGAIGVPNWMSIANLLGKNRTCVIDIPAGRLERMGSRRQARNEGHAGLRCLEHNQEGELSGWRIFLFGFAVTL